MESEINLPEVWLRMRYRHCYRLPAKGRNLGEIIKNAEAKRLGGFMTKIEKREKKLSKVRAKTARTLGMIRCRIQELNRVATVFTDLGHTSSSLEGMFLAFLRLKEWSKQYSEDGVSYSVEQLKEVATSLETLDLGNLLYSARDGLNEVGRIQLATTTTLTIYLFDNVRGLCLKAVRLIEKKEKLEKKLNGKNPRHAAESTLRARVETDK